MRCLGQTDGTGPPLFRATAAWRERGCRRRQGRSLLTATGPVGVGVAAYRIPHSSCDDAPIAPPSQPVRGHPRIHGQRSPILTWAGFAHSTHCSSSSPSLGSLSPQKRSAASCHGFLRASVCSLISHLLRGCAQPRACSPFPRCPSDPDRVVSLSSQASDVVRRTNQQRPDDDRRQRVRACVRRRAECPAAVRAGGGALPACLCSSAFLPQGSRAAACLRRQ